MTSRRSGWKICNKRNCIPSFGEFVLKDKPEKNTEHAYGMLAVAAKESVIFQAKSSF
jgi:hypothetical protein